MDCQLKNKPALRLFRDGRVGRGREGGWMNGKKEGGVVQDKAWSFYSCPKTFRMEACPVGLDLCQAKHVRLHLRCRILRMEVT